MLLASAACADRVAGPADRFTDAQMRVTASVAGTDIATLVVRVSAPDISVPLVFNLTVNGGTATGTIKMPPGEARTINVKAYNTVGDVTAEGTKTINVEPGNKNPPLSMPMIAKSGHVDITVQLGAVSIVLSGAPPSLNVAGTAQLAATITAPNGDVLTNQPDWATADPSVASVSASGLVTGLRSGTTSIVATFAGVAAVTQLTVVGGTPLTVGFPVDFGAGISFSTGELLAMEVQFASTMVVDKLGYIGKPTLPGTLRMALYRDLNGTPSELVVGTAASPIATGSQSLPVSPTVVTAGTYWLAMTSDVQMAIGFGGPTTNYVRMPLVAGAPLPSVFLPDNSLTTASMNMFASGSF